MIFGSKFHFDAAHCLHNPKTTEEENTSLYGKCHNIHGHRFQLVVEAQGEVNSDGWVMNFKEFKILVNNVLDELDHKNITVDIPYFKTHVCTAENLVGYIWNKLQKTLQAHHLKLRKVKLYETEHDFVKYYGEDNESN